MSVGYLVVSRSRPGIVQAVNSPRQLLLASSISAASMEGYSFYATARHCRPGDPLPSLEPAPAGTIGQVKASGY